MFIPYLLMAIATVTIGLMGPNVEEFFTRSLGFSTTPLFSSHQIPSAAEQHAILISSLGSLAMLALGGGAGYFIYISRKLNPSSIVGQSGPARSLYNFLWNRWYINPVYYRVFVYGSIAAARAIWLKLELGFFDRISGAVATFSVDLSRSGQRVDLGAVDGMINHIASIGRRISSTITRIQTGIPQDYVIVFSLGLLALVVAALFFFVRV